MIRKPKIDYATVSGRVFVDDKNYQILVLSARRYREKIMRTVEMLSKGLSK